MALDPNDRPAQQLDAMVGALAEHNVKWVMVGSQVLALHGADLAPNDLDVLPELSAPNLDRLATCLESLGAVSAYLDGWGGERGTLEACRAWRPRPATAKNLDWLMVTPLGLLDIVIEFAAEPYEVALRHASTMEIGGHPTRVCHPCRVLKALQGRSRRKDRERYQLYEALREKFRCPQTSRSEAERPGPAQEQT